MVMHTSPVTVMVTETLVDVVVAPRGLPVTARLKGPVVADVVDTVRTLFTPVEFGVTGLVAKRHDTPTGRGATQDNVTAVALPEVSFAVIVTGAELPWAMLTGPLFVNE